MFYFNLDNHNSKTSLKLEVTRRPTIPAPERDIKAVTIPGRGIFYKDNKTFKDMIIDIECNFIEHPDSWHERFRTIKRILSMNPKKLYLSDNKGFFYKIKRCIISECERNVVESGEFTISFTVDAYQYLDNGSYFINYRDALYNNYEESRPVYKITGEGFCNLNVNGNIASFNVGQNIIIDTENMIAYRENGESQNHSIDMYYEDFYLKNGMNNISVSDGFTLKIMPNWRCL